MPSRSARSFYYVFQMLLKHCNLFSKGIGRRETAELDIATRSMHRRMVQR